MASRGFFPLICIFVFATVLLFLSPDTGDGRPMMPEDIDQGASTSTLGPVNLTGPASQMQPEPAHVQPPPDYMLELYHRFTNDRTAMPKANTVRGFRNEDATFHTASVNDIRKHLLLFNVSIPHHEQVIATELHLHPMLQKDFHHYGGLERQVTVFEVQEEGHRRKETRGKEEQGERIQLASRQISHKDNGLEAFDLTDVVNRWHKSRYTPQRLEIHIASISKNGQSGHFDGKSMRHENTDTYTGETYKPLIIIFSDDRTGDYNQQKQESNGMTGYENMQNGKDMDFWGKGIDGKNQGKETVSSNTGSRIRRHAGTSECKKSSLYVDFKDIGWNNWIIAPQGYDAFECKGTCNFPLTEHLTPTKHAIVQTLVNLKSPQRVAKACCVPTKLEPISLLYNENGVTTYKSKYENMVVSECGCR